jgi:hypothetical protein
MCVAYCLLNKWDKGKALQTAYFYTIKKQDTLRFSLCRFSLNGILGSKIVLMIIQTQRTMKNTFKIALLSAGLFAASQSFAQEHKSVGKAIGGAAKDVGHATGEAAEDVGHKTSEVSVKGATAIVGKRYDGHWAPTGELVYIDKHSRYYYVDKRGHYKYLKKAQLRTTKLDKD